MIKKVTVEMATGRTDIKFFDGNDDQVFAYVIDEAGDFDKVCWNASGIDDDNITMQKVSVIGTNNHISTDHQPVGYDWQTFIEAWGDLNVSSSSFQIGIFFQNNWTEPE